MSGPDFSRSLMNLLILLSASPPTDTLTSSGVSGVISVLTFSEDPVQGFGLGYHGMCTLYPKNALLLANHLTVYRSRTVLNCISGHWYCLQLSPYCKIIAFTWVSTTVEKLDIVAAHCVMSVPQTPVAGRETRLLPQGTMDGGNGRDAYGCSRRAKMKWYTL